MGYLAVSFVGVFGGHFLVRSVLGGGHPRYFEFYIRYDHQHQQQPQSPPQPTDPMEALKFADFRAYGNSQQNGQSNQGFGQGSGQDRR